MPISLVYLVSACSTKVVVSSPLALPVFGNLLLDILFDGWQKCSGVFFNAKHQSSFGSMSISLGEPILHR